MPTDPSHIRDLRPDPKNRRKHTPRNLGMLEDALHEVGAARSIVIDEDNQILAGNGVVEAAGNAGITGVQVVDADGSTLVAVRRRGLSDDQKRRLALYDNRVAELAEWDRVQLEADRSEGLDLNTFFRDHELAAILNDYSGDNPADHWKGMPEFEQQDRMAWKRLIVNFRNQADYEAFSRLVNQTLTDRTDWIWYPAEQRAKSTGAYVESET